jgi:uncharacterized protein YndB with AHSA1/START domain
MRNKIIGVIVVIGVLLVAFLAFAATRPGEFRYERSGIIEASAEKIFPYLQDFKLAARWNPYDKIDPAMKKTYSGTDGQPGSTMEFEGNREVGSGKLEILKVVPNESVDIKLTMVKPFYAENLVQYRLEPQEDATRFVWTMSGKNPFLIKAIGVFIDCEKMLGDQFVAGIANLKAEAEAKK